MMSNGIRQFHRWTSVAFVAAVIFTTVALAQKGPVWVSYVPLAPLALLSVTGIYMFLRPYFQRRRAAAAA
jgi:membrane protein CcdC involved in cytochrome C biogenesis